jgi:hypothetical protein
MKKSKNEKKVKTAVCEVEKKPVKKEVLKGIHISGDLKTATAIMESEPVQKVESKPAAPGKMTEGMKKLQEAIGSTHGKGDIHVEG